MSDFLELESLKVGHGRLYNTFVKYFIPGFNGIEKLSWKTRVAGKICAGELETEWNRNFQLR